MTANITREQKEVFEALVTPGSQDQRLARIQAVEDRIADRCAEVIEGMLDFDMVELNQLEPPPEWVEKYGPEVARRRLVSAKGGKAPAYEAPSAQKVAVQVYNGIVRGRAFRSIKVTQNNLNVKIQLPAPTSKEFVETEAYPTKEIEQ